VKHVVGDYGAHGRFPERCESVSRRSHPSDGIAVSLKHLFPDCQVKGIVFDTKNQRLRQAKPDGVE
jgi:hypothetical protein